MIERKISFRASREELIKKGVIKERREDTIEEANESQATVAVETQSSHETKTTEAVVNTESAAVQDAGKCISFAPIAVSPQDWKGGL